MQIKRGDKGKEVKLIQEWLNLHGIFVDIDGVFGPATETAVKRFQREHAHLGMDGVVDEQTMASLAWPLERAMKQVPPQTAVGLTIVEVARRHLYEHPREIGGPNAGPWVRAYCAGNDGPKWLWCAGFVCTVLEQAYKAHDQKPPFPQTYSCDAIAKMSSTKMVCVGGGEQAIDKKLRAGSIFLIRKSPTDWIHAGIVTRFGTGEIFETIEGNSNDEGSRNGHEVCARIRSYSQRIDFIPV